MNTSGSGTSAVAVTEGSVDPLFNQPCIEVNEQRKTPVPHRYVHGGFRDTDARFSFYFPPQHQYQGRFFHNTYPMAVSSDIGPFPIQFEVAIGDLGFTVDSGAYYVQTNNGRVFRSAGIDPAIAAYRVNAAAAKYSRVVATELYGKHRPFGYLFGGSGGAYQTMGAAENTRGVWDGFVPFVPGCNHAIPSMFTVRMHALRVLRQRDRFPAIADALAPGGSGDPYDDLNTEEAAALREVSLMGYPLRGWYGHETLGSGYFSNIAGMIPAMDPTYAEDFWSKPGYLGTDPGSGIGAERFQHETAVVSVSSASPRVVEIEQVPEVDCANAHLVVLSGAAAGATLPVAHSEGGLIHLIAVLDSAVVDSLHPGDRVRIDNSWALALQTYHRHQVPPEVEYYGWDQFRDRAGRPIYPQRKVLVGPAGTANSAGSVLTGRIQGKVLTLAALLDIDAFPWQADWYRSKVATALGPAFEDSFALWFIDNAHHENPLTLSQRAHVVSYSGALQQALRDLANWVEEGVRPAETAYRVADTQVEVPADAIERRGIQPVVKLTVNDAERVEIAVGDTAAFSATIEVPPGAGRVVSAAWDFEGSGTFPDVAGIDTPGERIQLTATHRYARPGTYFAVLRAASQRDGNTHTPYCRVENLARVRVVVR